MNILDPNRQPVIVAAVRTAVGKAKRGSLAAFRPDEMAAVVIQELLSRVEVLDPVEIDDFILGCAFPEGPQGMNMARMVALRAGLPVSVPAETVNRFCASGIQSIAHAGYAIMAGQMEVAIAGGTESMSMVPMAGFKFSPHPDLAAEYPESFTRMGLTAENVAEQYGVTRKDQDEFSLRSHNRAVAAVNSGLFDEEIVPLRVEIAEPGANGQPKTRSFTFERDEGPRSDTSMEALGRLRPAFKVDGTVTAGSSSQMSDGASGVVIMSRARADALGLKPMDLAATWPFLNFSSAGMLSMPNLAASSPSSSTLHFITLMPESSVPSCSTMGPSIWQGPHHVAQKSTTTGCVLFKISVSKFAAVNLPTAIIPTPFI